MPLATEVQRSAAHRSLGMDPKPQPTNLKVKRPSLGDRHKSAPLIPRSAHVPVWSTTASSRSQPKNAKIVPDTKLGAVDEQPSCSPISLLVLGNESVGKSTFIRSVSGSKESLLPVISTFDLSLAGDTCGVQLCELALDDLELVDGQLVNWPKALGNVPFPAVDGVLCLYDVTNKESIIGVPQVLHALSKLQLPTTLIACKTDLPSSEQEVDTTFTERVQRSFPLVDIGDSSSAHIESARKCLMVTLRGVLAISKLKSETQTYKNRKSEPPKLVRVRTADLEQNYSRKIEPQSSASKFDLLSDRAGALETLSSGAAGQSFLDMEDDSLSGSSDSLDAQLEHMTLRESSRNEHGDGGTTIADLVDRLLQMPATKNDAKFVPAFLCLYRCFSTPRRLLVAIIERFLNTDQSDLVPLTKVGELLRYLQVLAQWTANYPGDFAESPTRRLAISFARDIEQSKNFAPAAREIVGNLLTIIMDDDRDWAFEDNEELEMPDSRRTTKSSILYEFKDESGQVSDNDLSDTDKDGRRRSIRNSGSTSSTVVSSIISSQSATNLFNLDNAREQSKLLKPIPRQLLSKTHWHQFMGIPNDELAREITRMDWTMYSAIRARDFIRHVSLSSQKRARYKHADTIGMMVTHFNHLALFVSGMILLRDKPKHRAKMLEKFMDLAWKVRQLNNYNSLGAIVAGITGPEIARLTQTLEQVPGETKKQFLRLTVLMSISRSYSTYRMAWDNSFSERIPFIPLVRQDLTMAASANQTFIGKNINWKKFEIMGDVIVGIQRSHDQPYSFSERTTRTQEITRLILDTRIIQDSEDSADPRGELYERSVQLEPHSGNDSRKSITAFGVKRTMSGWFQT